MTKPILILGLDRNARRTLLALSELSAPDRPTSSGLALLAGARKPVDAPALARRLGVSTEAVLQDLQALDARGLVWAARCRLTLAGLATAARLSALRALAGRHGRAA